MKSVLYISYDGMTDPLGQSQVLPYLKGLSNRGHRITILSCEKQRGLRDLRAGDCGSLVRSRDRMAFHTLLQATARGIHDGVPLTVEGGGSGESPC